jgi:hypothetical protein
MTDPVVIDLDDLVGEAEQPTPPVLRFRGQEIIRPAAPPSSLVSALGRFGWAQRVNSETETARATSELAAAVNGLVGESVAAALPLDLLIKAVIGAYGLGKSSDSSPT